MSDTLTSTVQASAEVDHRFGRPGETCYGFVVFPGTDGEDDVRVGYTIGSNDGTPDIWPANWGPVLPWHLQAAANVLIEHGFLVPRNGKVSVQFSDEGHLIRADYIDQDLRALVWKNRPHVRGRA